MYEIRKEIVFTKAAGTLERGEPFLEIMISYDRSENYVSSQAKPASPN